MDIQKLKDDIERLARLVAGWSQQAPVAGIERELALEKLRNLYEMILSGAVPDQATATPAEPSAAAPETAPVAGSPAAPEDGARAGSPVAGDEPEAVAAPVADTAAGRGEPAPVSPEQARPAGGEPADQKLFNDEQAVRPRMDKQVILSLYGEPPVSQTSAPRPAPGRVSEPASPAPRTAPAADTYAADGNGQKKVLGEVIASGSGSAMNEVLGKQTAHTDVASRLQSRSIRGDLHNSIGINDRFMLIRSLFDGNGEAYSAMIARLNEFDDLDEAMLHIQETYTWNPDSEAVQLLVDLLERKLG